VANITPNELKRLFPGASKSTHKRNEFGYSKVEVGANAFFIGPHFKEVKPIERPQTDEQRLNKTEKAYLAVLRSLGVKNLGIQNITLKIADDCRFTPDFNYLAESGVMIFVDVKGFQREDAFIKIKVAARMFPQFGFQIVKKDKNIGWDVQAIKP